MEHNIEQLFSNLTKEIDRLKGLRNTVQLIQARLGQYNLSDNKLINDVRIATYNNRIDYVSFHSFCGVGFDVVVDTRSGSGNDIPTHFIIKSDNTACIDSVKVFTDKGIEMSTLGGMERDALIDTFRFMADVLAILGTQD